MDLVFDWGQETDHLVLNTYIYRIVERSSLGRCIASHPSQWFNRISVGQN